MENIHWTRKLGPFTATRCNHVRIAELGPLMFRSIGETWCLSAWRVALFGDGWKMRAGLLG